jgi:hypothetical protein
MLHDDILQTIDADLQAVRKAIADPFDQLNIPVLLGSAQYLWRQIVPLPPKPKFQDLDVGDVHRSIGSLDRRLAVLDLLLEGLTDLQRFVIKEAKNAAPAAAASSADKIIGKGVAPRNAKFLEWYEATGTDTYHKYTKIYAKWDNMTATDRAAICPDSPNKIAQGTVKSCVTRARMARRHINEVQTEATKKGR